MKKLNKLLLLSYIGPLILTFFISLFVFVMQFLWKYMDDLIGKGLDAFVIMKLIFFASAHLVPMALPIAVLLSAIMVFGSFGENYELAAIKSSGISLTRFMRPLIVFTMFLSGFAFFFSNNVIPRANLEMGSLLYDIRRTKPTLSINSGIFNNDIDGYSIRAGNKDGDGKTLYDLVIYDHTSGRGNDMVITAKKGEMFQSLDETTLILKLYDGYQYKEMPPGTAKENQRKHYRTEFEEYEKRFDLTQFDMNSTDKQLFKHSYRMMNIAQLDLMMDTLNDEYQQTIKNMDANMVPHLSFLQPRYDSTGLTAESALSNVPGFLNMKELLREMEASKRIFIVQKAAGFARNVKSYPSSTMRDLEGKKERLTKFEIAWHQKFKLSLACLVFFFIGAPLGAIIRKGGLGWPVAISIVMFVVFYVLSITGEKVAEAGNMTSFWGVWMSMAVLTPIAMFLTYKASRDSSILSSEAWIKVLRLFRPTLLGHIGDWLGVKLGIIDKETWKDPYGDK